MLVFNRQRLRARPAPLAPDTRFLADMVEQTLLDRLCDIKRTFPRTLWIGDGISPAGLGQLKRAQGVETLMVMGRDPATRTLEADEEALPFANGTLDLVVAGAGFDLINDLPGALIQIRRALKPDGVFIGAIAGGETLFQLRAALIDAETRLRGGASPRIHPMLDTPTLAGLLQRAGFALPVVDSDIIPVYYRSLGKLVSDIRGMRAGLALNAHDHTYVGKQFWPAVAQSYHTLFGTDDGLLPAHFEFLYLIGWAPHETQPQPLKRGSAQNRLADALGTTEHSAGETTPLKQ